MFKLAYLGILGLVIGSALAATVPIELGVAGLVAYCLALYEVSFRRRK